MKKEVVINVLDGDAMEMVPSGRVILEDGVIRFVGLNEKFIRSLEEDGIIGKTADGFFYPKDGDRFLDALQREFSGSAVRASAPEVK